MIHTIDLLPEFNTVMVIINVDTKESTTLALLPALRFTKFPVLVLNHQKLKKICYCF